MRHRVSWLIMVVIAALAAGWLTGPLATGAPDAGTDLAATPCIITARTSTIGDPTIRFSARVTFGRRYYARIPSTTAATTVDFIALPSHTVVKSIRLTGSFITGFHVPDRTTEIGVRLTTGGNVDPTVPATRDNLGHYVIDARTPTTRTWSIRNASRAGSEPTPTPTPRR